MDDELKKQLKEAATVAEMLDAIKKYYKLEECIPGVMQRSTLIYGLSSAIKTLNPVKR